ncbi:DUF4124 domain-containing protein [Alcanivorax sp. DP30]|uniref:DUF4124 domain-containing protein n=1 Tax=Alcanivorax sp. DP30 TaxID=2606217 RepID=UPI001369746D|nr:DUF4124 domain-containing protein [Alcanivorax sp. DP30]MZR61374.1 DUF4124 domain-containing protein [Alcanivorax sp. DP30]
MSRFSLFLSLALLALASPGMAEKFYKWVDENGVTHYGTQAPNGTQASEINTRTNASSSQGDAIEALNARRQAEARKREKTEQAATESKRAAENPTEVTKERCEEHKKNLETLQNSPVVRTENPDTGKLEVIDQERREKMIEEAREALELCD